LHLNAALGGFGCGEGGGELRTAVERVRAFAGLSFNELRDDREPLGLGEAGDGGALRLRSLRNVTANVTVRSAS
jgi:hypothetical protein